MKKLYVDADDECYDRGVDFLSTQANGSYSQEGQVVLFRNVLPTELMFSAERMISHQH
jgi:hypothetical protein